MFRYYDGANRREQQTVDADKFKEPCEDERETGDCGRHDPGR